MVPQEKCGNFFFALIPPGDHSRDDPLDPQLSHKVTFCAPSPAPGAMHVIQSMSPHNSGIPSPYAAAQRDPSHRYDVTTVTTMPLHFALTVTCMALVTECTDACDSKHVSA